MKRASSFLMRFASAAVAAVVAMSALPANAGTRYVGGDNASDDNAGTATAPYATLYKAMSELNVNDMAGLNSVIYVRPGIYTVTNATYLHRNNLSLIGESGNADDVVFDGGGAANIITSTGTYTGNRNRILNVTFSNAVSTAVSMNSDNLLVSNCVFRCNKGRGLSLHSLSCTGCIVTHCVFEDNGNTNSLLGGACYASATFRHCAFRRNQATWGGAVCSASSSSSGYPNSAAQVTMDDCEFTGNFASAVGGAVLARSTNGIVNCSFVSNVASNESAVSGANSALSATALACGGALVVYSTQGVKPGLQADTLVSNCVFRANAVYGGNASVLFSRNQNTRIVDCEFNCNTGFPSKVTRVTSAIDSTHFTGTAYVSTQTVERCRFIGNVSKGSGAGAIYARQSGTVRNCLFADNRNETGAGGAIVASARYVFDNCTFAGNHAKSWGGGMAFVAYTCGVTNCLFVLNEAGNTTGTYATNGVNVGWTDTTSSWKTKAAPMFGNCMEVIATADGSAESGRKGMLFVSETSTVNVGTADGYFTDAANGDYTLKKSSPARDAGTNAPWMVDDGEGGTILDTDAIDLAGKVRVYGDTVDIGCYEYIPPKARAFFIIVR